MRSVALVVLVLLVGGCDVEDERSSRHAIPVVVTREPSPPAERAYLVSTVRTSSVASPPPSMPVVLMNAVPDEPPEPIAIESPPPEPTVEPAAPELEERHAPLDDVLREIDEIVEAMLRLQRAILGVRLAGAEEPP